MPTGMDKRDYYEVLGVSRTATEAEIKRSYRKLAKQFHPDQNRGDKHAETRFKEVQEAYDVLSDKDKRGRYDQFGHAGLDPRYGAAPGGGVTWTTRDGEGVDFSDFADIFSHIGGRGEPSAGSGIFEQLFGGRAGREARGRSEPPGRDVEHEVSLSFEQAIRGTTLDVEVASGHGAQRLSVHVPPGVRDGQKIRVRGQGESKRGRSGDLHVTCRVQPHPYFHREGDDIYLSVPVTISEAALGAKIDLPTVDGVRTVTIPPGTASGAKLRLAGLGAPNPKDGRRGDHYAVIKIVPPGRPSAEQRRLLEELAQLDTTSPREGLWR